MLTPISASAGTPRSDSDGPTSVRTVPSESMTASRSPELSKSARNCPSAAACARARSRTSDTSRERPTMANSPSSPKTGVSVTSAVNLEPSRRRTSNSPLHESPAARRSMTCAACAAD